MSLSVHVLLHTDKNGTKAAVVCGDACAAMTARHPRPCIDKEKTFGKFEAARAWAEEVAGEWVRGARAKVIVRRWRDGKEITA